MSVTRPTENATAHDAMLLTTQQAAALAGISERTLWRWSRSGLAPRPLQIGAGRKPAIRYRRSDMLTWIADGCPRCEKGGGR